MGIIIATRPRWIGLAAIAVTVVTWAGFALSARAVAHSTLTAVDVAVLRYATPALLLAPWWPRAWREVRRCDPRVAVLVATGAGVPFLLLTALGARLSSSTHVAVVNPGAAPIWVALIGFAGKGRLRASRGPRWTGLALVAAGIAVLALATPGGGGGVPALLGSAALWAVYSLAQQHARLTLPTAILLIAAPSAVVAGALAVLDGVSLAALRASAPSTVLTFLLVQGVGVGVVSTLSYTVAVQRLGAPLAAALGAVTPALVALLSTALLHESLTAGGGLGLALVVLGVVGQVWRGRDPARAQPSSSFGSRARRADSTKAITSAS